MRCAGLKAWRRSRFATTVRLLTDLDEDGLKYVLKNLPAWVKVRADKLPLHVLWAMHCCVCMFCILSTNMCAHVGGAVQ